MARQLLELTPNTDQQFNVDYAQIQTREFVGAILFNIQNPAGVHFTWINVNCYPRVNIQMGNDVLMKELSIEDRTTPISMRVNAAQQKNGQYRLFLRWQRGVYPDYLNTVCERFNQEVTQGTPSYQQMLNRYEDIVKTMDGKILVGWELAEKHEGTGRWYTRKIQSRYLPMGSCRLDPLPECAKGPLMTDQEYSLAYHAAAHQAEDRGMHPPDVPLDVSPARQIEERQQLERLRQEEQRRGTETPDMATGQSSDAFRQPEAGGSSTFPGQSIRASTIEVTSGIVPASGPPGGTDDIEMVIDVPDEQAAPTGNPLSSYSIPAQQMASGGQSAAAGGGGGPPDDDGNDSQDEGPPPDRNPNDGGGGGPAGGAGGGGHEGGAGGGGQGGGGGGGRGRDNRERQDPRPGPSTARNDDDDEELLPPLASVKTKNYPKQMEDMRKQIESKRNQNPAEGFRKPASLEDTSVLRGDFEKYMYQSMRQIVKTHTWLLETIYDNNITVQEVTHGQDVLVRGLDHLEKLNLQRLGAMKKMGAKINTLERDIKAIKESTTAQRIVTSDARLHRERNEAIKVHTEQTRLMEVLTEDVLRFDRLTEANLFLINCKGFQRAVTELIIRQLPAITNGNFTTMFNTWFFKIIFTDRLACHFYVESSYSHNNASYTIPLPNSLVILRNEILKYQNVTGDLRNRVIDRFQKKPGDMRETRRNLYRNIYGPSMEERIMAETELYEEHRSVREDHEWYVQKFIAQPKPMIPLDDFLASSRFKRMSDDRYRATKDRTFLTEQKGPDHSMSFMKGLCEELDKAFLAPDRPSKRSRGSGSDKDDSDDNDRRDDDDRGGGGGGGGKGKKPRREPSDDDSDEDFNPHTPVKKSAKDTKTRSKSTKSAKKRFNWEDEVAPDSDHSSGKSRRSDSHERSESRSKDDRRSKDKRRSEESNRSSTGSSKSSGSAKSSDSSRSGKSSKSSGSSKSRSDRSPNRRDVRVPPPVTAIQTPSRDNRMGKLSKEHKENAAKTLFSEKIVINRPGSSTQPAISKEGDAKATQMVRSARSKPSMTALNRLILQDREKSSKGKSQRLSNDSRPQRQPQTRSKKESEKRALRKRPAKK